MRRVLLFNNTPAPYFVPLFEALGRRSGWSLTVSFASRWKADTGWRRGELATTLRGVETRYLDEEPSPGGSWLGRQAGAVLVLLRFLWRERPDYLLIYGYTLPPQMTLILWGLVTRTPFAVIGDANIHCDRARGLRRRLKRCWLGVILRRAAVVPTIGEANRQFWLSYGAREEQLAPVPFSVDNDFFAKEAARSRAQAVEERCRLGLSEAVVFLSVGRLIPRKNLATLIRAFRRVESAKIGLLIVGTGEERVRLEQLAAGDRRIHLVGGVAPTDLPRWYAMSDVLVLLSENEPWGLVINEAMACGLAILTHRHCGAAPDLVDHQNGIVLEGWGEEEIAQALRQLSGSEEEGRRALQQSSREKIARWGIEATVQGLIEAVERTPFRASRRRRDHRRQRGERSE
jgi:glycosyltransferase involved in cell wall biosynthesis